ncbi:lipid II:glycine glycyltransferase FemX [Leucobacter sp. W1478]|uniref:lipid II:glycine glycyltransferase FemX n=1 Tax=Leucobacter sp. W1478 TaxID=3439065 RepID=UPI003F323088
MNDTTLTARYATSTELDRWDSLVAANPGGGEFLAARAFADTKSQVGWVPRYLVFARASTIHSVALVLERQIPLLGLLWYIPRGPAAPDFDAFAEHLLALHRFARAAAPQVFTITVEPPIVAEEEAGQTLPPELLAQGLDVRSRPALQGNATTAIVRIDRSDEELLTSFDKKCRNMVRRAERDGATVRQVPSSPETFAHMHRLMRLVGGGSADLALRAPQYSETLWQGFTEAGQGQFYAIDSDGTPAVMGFLIRMGDRAFYKDGGSERDRVTPGMSNLLVWQMMRDARDAGATEIDLFGVAPAWAQSTADHPAYGLGLFKLSFSRERTTYVGAFDLVLQPRRFRLWQRFGERLAGKLHRKRFQDLGLY